MIAGRVKKARVARPFLSCLCHNAESPRCSERPPGDDLPRAGDPRQTCQTARIAPFGSWIPADRRMFTVPRSVKGGGIRWANDVLWCDGLALGSPTNMALLSWKMKRFWDEPMAPHWMKVNGKIACAFSSSGGWSGGTELACQSLLTVLLNFGFLVFGVTDLR